MKATCWHDRRRQGDVCRYPRRAEESGCDGCCLALIDDKGRSPRQQAILYGHLRDEIAAARARGEPHLHQAPATQLWTHRND